MAKSVAWSQSNLACFSVTEDKTEGRKTLKQAATQGGCSEDLAKHLQGGSSMGSRLQAVIDCKGFPSKN